MDFVSVLARIIIGQAALQVGVHSTGGWTGEYLTACLSVVERAKAADWLTQTDFFVASYAMMVWKPATAHVSLMAAAAGAGTVSPAESSYKFQPL